MKLLCGVIVLACVPLARGKNDADYPKEKLPEFLVEKLDVTTFPSRIRPKPEKGKKTFGDYGYTTRKVDEKEALVEAPHGGSEVTIRVLEQSASGIYVCVDSQGQNTNNGRIQQVRLLMRKNANGLLKSKESWKEFDGCPVIGGQDNDSHISSY
jgi:hypothetical protein